MKKFNLFLSAVAVTAMSAAVSSCSDDNHDSWEIYRPTALVTVMPASDGSFSMWVESLKYLTPTNMKTSPFGNKEVRALVNYSNEEPVNNYESKVHVNWIDSIRTKLPAPFLASENDAKYGNDPIEVIDDWVTIAEDGYLTLRVRTRWGYSGIPHHINLLTGMNPDDPYEVELRHDARGDKGDRVGDALIAFNLNDLPRPTVNDAKIKLHWKSFAGAKSHEFDLELRPVTGDVPTDGLVSAKLIK